MKQKIFVCIGVFITLALLIYILVKQQKCCSGEKYGSPTPCTSDQLAQGCSTVQMGPATGTCSCPPYYCSYSPYGCGCGPYNPGDGRPAFNTLAECNKNCAGTPPNCGSNTPLYYCSSTSIDSGCACGLSNPGDGKPAFKTLADCNNNCVALPPDFSKCGTPPPPCKCDITSPYETCVGSCLFAGGPMGNPASCHMACSSATNCTAQDTPDGCI